MKPTQVADQESLQFKMVYGLQALGLRIFIQPDFAHQIWNDVKGGVKRGGKQFTFLLSLVMQNMAHGPFKSGRNAQTLRESAEELANKLTLDEFDSLVDQMEQDHCHFDDAVDDPERLPQSPSDIPRLRVFNTLPCFAPSL